MAFRLPHTARLALFAFAISAGSAQAMPAPENRPQSCALEATAVAFPDGEGSRLIKRDIADKLGGAAGRDDGAAASARELADYVRSCYGAQGLFYLSAAYTLGGTRWHDPAAAARLLREAAAGAYAPAQTLLGLNQLVGSGGFTANEQAALHLLRQAVASHEAAAMVWLGLAYEAGKVGGKTTADAAELYLRAARAGYAPGATAAARLILNKQMPGSQKDALDYLERARQDDPEAKYLLATLLFSLAGDNEAVRERAAELLSESAEECYAPARKALSERRASRDSLVKVDFDGAGCKSAFWNWILR